MSTLFITYSNVHNDGRTKALIAIMKDIDDVKVIAPKQDDLVKDGELLIDSKGYMDFIRKGYKFAKELIKNDDIECIFIDNRRATLLGLLLLRKFNFKYSFYDARELYLMRESTGFSGKLGCIFEKQMIEKVDYVICANENRKVIMTDEYRSKNPIEVFDNFRKLEWSKEAKVEEYEKKYKELFSEDSFKIISTAGCDLERLTDDLVRGFGKLSFNKKLILVGCKENDDKLYIENLINENNIVGVEFIPRVDQDELKYLISKSDAGVSMYHKKNSNHLYCSSGKIYEYIYEGKPIIASTNPTLKSVVDQYAVGSCSDDIGEAMADVYSNYEKYLLNVKKFVEGCHVEKAQKDFKNKIADIMGDSKNE